MNALKNLTLKQYEVIDNFLSDEKFSLLKNLIFNKNNTFPWKFQKGIVKDPKLGLTNYEQYNWMYVHLLYDSCRENIEIKKYFKDIRPILNKINPKIILRAQINALVPTNEHIYHDYHVDKTNHHQVGLFYLTTCNGYTEILNTSKIDCVENRMLIFNGSLEHRSVTSTDHLRSVINLNFK